MSNKELKIKGRVQNKHKTEEAWLLDVYPDGNITLEPRVDAFIPLDGELIIYDPDSVYTERRIKIGDGRTNVVALPFQQNKHIVYSRGLAYALSDDGTYYSVTGIGTCKDTDIVISSTYNGLPIKSIDSNAFYGCSSLTSITIPNSVTSISDNAFSECTSLTSIVIPASVTSIGAGAFEDCTSLTSVTIGDSVTSIGEWAFACCSSLASITIPDSVTSIGGAAFLGCPSLTSIVIPDSVTSMGNAVFSNCPSLTIYCEATSKPSGWNSTWNPQSRTVVWGFAGDFIGIHEKMKHYQLQMDENLETESKEVVGAINEVNSKVGTPIVTTTGTGAAYEATVEGITELKAGVSFIMIPHTNATTSSPTLKVNDCPAIQIYRNLSTGHSYTSATKTILKEGRACRVMYDGTYWIAVDFTVPVSAELSGRVPVGYGGVPGSSVSNKGQILRVDDNGTPVWSDETTGGGSSSDNVVSRYTVTVGPSTTINEVITAMETAGATVSAWNIVDITGHTTGTYGLTVSKYTDTVWNIEGVNLRNMTTISNTNNWTSVTVGEFEVQFRYPLPQYFPEEDEGKILRIVNGVPAWASIPNAEDNSF